MLCYAALSSITLPFSARETLSIPSWKKAMETEMQALLDRNTRDLVDLPAGCQPVDCRCVFLVKYQPDGTVEQLKALLMAKDYRQTYGIVYFDTFSLVARLNSMWVLISVAVILIGLCTN